MTPYMQASCTVIPTFALKPKRDAACNPIPGRFVRFWGGRKPSKYVPHIEDKKHGIKAA